MSLPFPLHSSMSPRRSLYFTQTMDLHERFLSMFDAADVLQCYRRDVSVLPHQALALTNSRVTLQMAANLAARLDRETLVSRGADRAESLAQAAFRCILTRQPALDEQAACVAFLRRAEKLLRAKPGGDRRALESLVVALLNHNDFVTIR